MKRGTLIVLLILILFLVGLFLAAGFIYLQITQEPSIPEQALLKIELRGALMDSYTGAFPFQSAPLTVRELWFQLERARQDERIRGVMLKISYLGGGLAKINEIGGLLESFRESGKPVFAFMEEGGIKEYLLASFADKVYAFKSGIYTINGLAAEAMFVKNTLAKLGIEAELFHIGDYKSATEMFTEDKMSPAHREATGKMLEDFQASIIELIAANRDLELEAVRETIALSPLSAEEYLQRGFFDELGYEDEVLTALDLVPGRLVDFGTYAKTSKPEPFPGQGKIAVLFADGEIITGKSGGSGMFGGQAMGSDTVAEQLRALRRNRSVKAVVLRVDSPGGSAVASEVIRREAELLLAEKPLIVSMSDLAASGGYWISLAATRVLAQPQTITGSIGVIMGKFVLKGFYDKIGVNKEILQTSETAAMFSDYRPFSPEEKKRVLSMMNVFYDDFVTKVAAARGRDRREIEAVAQGRVWSGRTALELNLIDALGGLPEAVAAAREAAGIAPEEQVGLIFQPRKKGFFEMILDMGQVKAGLGIRELEASLEKLQQSLPAYIMPFKLVFTR